MVSSPFYDLEKVRRLAKNGAIAFSRTARRDVRNLGYSNSFVYSVITMLEKKDYYKSHCYTHSAQDGKTIEQHCDVYRKTVAFDGNADDLYIKFSLIDDYLEIDLLSFHLNR